MTEVLRAKHPAAWPPTASSMDTYPDSPPELFPMEINEKNGDRGGGTNLRRGRAGGDRISDPLALAPAFQSGKQGAAANCFRLRGVVKQWEASMGATKL